MQVPPLEVFSGLDSEVRDDRVVKAVDAVLGNREWMRTLNWKPKRLPYSLRLKKKPGKNSLARALHFQLHNAWARPWVKIGRYSPNLTQIPTENSIGKNEPLHASFSRPNQQEDEVPAVSVACAAPEVVDLVVVDLVVVDLVVVDVDSDLPEWEI